MKILKLNLENYKSFRSSGWLDFSPNFTVVIGQNNAGKSALLEAFKLASNSNHPHRMLSRAPEVELDQQSFADFDFSISGLELRNSLLASGGARSIPIPPDGTPEANEAAVLSIFQRPLITLKLKAVFQSTLAARTYPSHGLFEMGSQRETCAVVSGNRRTQSINLDGVNLNANDELPNLAAHAYPKSIYVFKAERLNIGKTGAAQSTSLNTDGSNLAAVLGSLQGNVAWFARYNKHITEILPTIQQVSVAMVGSEFEVRVWSVDPATEREDLAIPLQESGTGVGQVLAILYVAMTVKSGVIVIDEPNSFLHPGAAKKLVQILRQYDQHQYVLATHSADLIATAKPEVIHLVRWKDGESEVERIASTKVDDLRDVLIEIGVSFSDLFGYDRAVWVEGPTEEICFPLILEKLLKRVELGLIFVAVRNTGDFEKKRDRKKLIWEIYEKLSAGGLLLPSIVSFSFDREERAEQDIADLRRQSQGRAHFLPRLTYENFLLDPGAIAALINSLPRAGRPDATPEQVAEWLTKNGGRFGGDWKGNFTDLNWLAKVHAPSLLKELLNELASPGDNFEKTTHSRFLTEWLIDNRPEALADIAEHIKILVEKTA